MVPAGAAEPEATKDRKVGILFVGFLFWMFGAQLTRSSQIELLLAHFNNDTVAMSALMGKVSTLSALIGMVINPIVGSAADAFGRKPALLLGSLFSVLRPAVWLFFPGVRGLIIAEAVAPVAQVCAILPPQAAIGDMYRHDQSKLASRQSLIFFVPAVCQIVCPVLGGALASRRVMLPFAIATMTATMSGVVALALPEPLPKSQRRPFRWLQSTPLSALTLFCRGRYMRALAIIQVLMDFSETAGRPDRGAAALVELHQKEMGWSIFQRSRFRSICGVVRSPGNLAVGPIIGAIGLQNALSIGFLNYIGQTLTFGVSARLGVHHCMAPTYFFNPLRLNVLSAAMSKHAAEVGLSQGQLRGAVTNLGSIVSMFSGLIWPQIYALGVRAGQPGLFYLPVGLVALVQLVITRLEVGREPGKAKH